MTIDRERVRALVRAELERQTGSNARSTAAPRSKTHVAAALLEIHHAPECNDLDLPTRRACVIEPDKPCINSGYCKKLGY